MMPTLENVTDYFAEEFLRLYIRQVACSQELRLVKLLQEATL